MSSEHGQVQAGQTLICPHCNTAAFAAVRGEAFWDGSDDQGDHVSEGVEWLSLQCSWCKQPSIQSRRDWGDGFDQDEPVIIYPSPRLLSPEVPASLRREFEEARACFSAKA